MNSFHRRMLKSKVHMINLTVINLPVGKSNMSRFIRGIAWEREFFRIIIIYKLNTHSPRLHFLSNSLSPFPRLWHLLVDRGNQVVLVNVY